MPTTKVTITAAAWTLVSAAGAGYMECQGPSPILYRTAVASPAATDNMGHSLGVFEKIGWSRAIPESIYAKAVTGSASLIVTEG